MLFFSGCSFVVFVFPASDGVEGLGLTDERVTLFVGVTVFLLWFIRCD